MSESEENKKNKKKKKLYKTGNGKDFLTVTICQNLIKRTLYKTGNGNVVAHDHNFKNRGF